MKKLLSTFGALGLTVTTTAPVVACKIQEYDKSIMRYTVKETPTGYIETYEYDEDATTKYVESLLKEFLKKINEKVSP